MKKKKRKLSAVQGRHVPPIIKVILSHSFAVQFLRLAGFEFFFYFLFCSFVFCFVFLGRDVSRLKIISKTIQQ